MSILVAVLALTVIANTVARYQRRRHDRRTIADRADIAAHTAFMHAMRDVPAAPTFFAHGGTR